MARPRNPATDFKVCIHKVRGHRYAATQPRITENDKTSRRYVHWGHVSEDLVFTPGLKWKTATQEERDRLIFPEGWSINTAEEKAPKGNGAELPKVAVPPGAAVDAQYNNRLYGAVWLLLKIAESIKLKEDLLSVLNNSTELYDEVITLAIFPLLSNRNYDRVARWQKYTKTPATQPLTSSYITRLTQRLTDNHRMLLIKSRLKRQTDKAMVACDSTTRSAWGHCLADIHWGHNKDNPLLENTVEVVVYSIDTHEPVYYRSFPGNMSDLRTVRTILKDLKELEIKQLTVIFDRGYESPENIAALLTENMPFIVCAKVKQEPVFSCIDEVKFDPNGLPDNMEYLQDRALYARQVDHRYVYRDAGDEQCEAVLKCNLFLNMHRRIEELQKIRSGQEEELRLAADYIAGLGEGHQAEESDCKRLNKELTYHRVVITADRKIELKARQEVLDKAVRTAGFFSSISYDVSGDAGQQNEMYRLRDEQEKYFDIMKEQMGFDIQRNWSEQGKTGRLFILFIGLILMSRVRYIWKTALRAKFETALAVLDEMEPVRFCEYPGGDTHITAFTQSQVDICTAFGIEAPAECLSKNQKRTLDIKKAGRKRGRPRKNAS